MWPPRKTGRDAETLKQGFQPGQLVPAWYLVSQPCPRPRESLALWSPSALCHHTAMQGGPACCCSWACSYNSLLASSQVIRAALGTPCSQGCFPRPGPGSQPPLGQSRGGEDPAFWNRQAAQALDVAKKLQPHIRRKPPRMSSLFLGMVV